MAYTVYILESERNGTYYVGSTADLNERLRRHNQGRSKYTKTATPWHVVYTESYETRSQAGKRERQIKNRKSREYIEGKRSINRIFSNSAHHVIVSQLLHPRRLQT